MRDRRCCCCELFSCAPGWPSPGSVWDPRQAACLPADLHLWRHCWWQCLSPAAAWLLSGCCSERTASLAVNLKGPGQRGTKVDCQRGDLQPFRSNSPQLEAGAPRLKKPFDRSLRDHPAALKAQGDRAFRSFIPYMQRICTGTSIPCNHAHQNAWWSEHVCRDWAPGPHLSAIGCIEETMQQIEQPVAP